MVVNAVMVMVERSGVEFVQRKSKLLGTLFVPSIGARYENRIENVYSHENEKNYHSTSNHSCSTYTHIQYSMQYT